MDGGLTWRLERPAAFNKGDDKGQAMDCPGSILFTHPDFAMRLRGNRFYYSYSRGRDWLGPFRLPEYGQRMGSRTEYIVNGPEDCMIFLRSEKGLACLRTTDGGKRFNIVSEDIGIKGKAHSIMPSTVRLSEDKLIMALRQLAGEPEIAWIDIYSSDDNGKTWNFLSKVADADKKYWNGNPPSMIKLKDGRIAVTYGYRAMPYGIRAKISSDNGKTWGPELILREDGINWDIGYSRTVQRADGKCVTMCYYSSYENYNAGIEALVWDPERISNLEIEKAQAQAIADNIDIIENSMNQVARLSSDQIKSVNPLVWWVQEKEMACDRISWIASEYFMARRIKPVVRYAGRAKPMPNMLQILILQQLLYENACAKSSEDTEVVNKLRQLQAQFVNVYFSDK
jgi:hypothetical protein